MMKRIALIGCAALMLGAVGCKKEKKAAKPKAEPAAKTTDTGATDMDKKPAEPAAKPMTADEKVKWYQDCFAAVSAKDWDKFAKCYSADAESNWVDSGMPATHGPDEILSKGAKPFAEAVPDWKVQPQVILQNGDKLGAVYLVTGTQSGTLKSPMGDIPPSNKKVGYYGFHIAQMTPDKGEVAKEWLFQDMGTFMDQIGMSKAPHRAPVEKGADQPTVVMAKNDDTEKNNLAAYQKMVDAFNKHDVKALSDNWADDVKIVEVAAPADADKKKSIAWHTELFKAVPDVKWAPTDTWAAGDYVVAVGDATGTNSGPMPSMGIKKATGKPTHFTAVDVVKYENGKMKEDWFFYNGAALAMQLGLMKPPAGAAPAPGGDKAGGEAAPAGGEKKMDEGKGAAKGEKKMKGGEKKPAEGGDQPK